MKHQHETPYGSSVMHTIGKHLLCAILLLICIDPCTLAELLCYKTTTTSDLLIKNAHYNPYLPSWTKYRTISTAFILFNTLNSVRIHKTTAYQTLLWRRLPSNQPSLSGISCKLAKRNLYDTHNILANYMKKAVVAIILHSLCVIIYFSVTRTRTTLIQQR
jgi:hypothetical protein